MKSFFLMFIKFLFSFWLYKLFPLKVPLGGPASRRQV